MPIDDAVDDRTKLVGVMTDPGRKTQVPIGDALTTGRKVRVPIDVACKCPSTTPSTTGSGRTAQ